MSGPFTQYITGSSSASIVTLHIQVIKDFLQDGHISRWVDEV
jgi:hypothetical protein